MRSHIFVHRATTNSSVKSFSFRSRSEKEGLPRGSTPDLEASAQRLVGKLAHLPGEQECHGGRILLMKKLLSVRQKD